MARKWIALKNADGKGGVRYREHPTRKHGAVPDRYFALQYWWQGKTVNEGVGWASSKWTPGKCFDLLGQLKQNQDTLSGPCTLRELRDHNQAVREEEQRQREADAHRMISFPDFFKQVFMPDAESRWKPETAEKARCHVKVWIGPVVGGMPLRDISLTHVQRIKANMAKKGRSPRTQQYCMRTFTMVWNAAKDHGIVERDSPTKASSFRLPKVDNMRLRVLTLEEEKALLKATLERSEQVHAITQVALDSGLRFGEIASLKWGNVDLEQGMLQVIYTKTSRDRIVPLTKRLIDLFESMARGKPNKLVFPNQYGERHLQVPSLFKRAVQDCKLNEDVDDRKLRFSFHSLRHTAGTRYYRANRDLYLTQRFLGHSTPVMTTRYAKVAGEDLRRGVLAMEQASEEKRGKVIEFPQGKEAEAGVG